MSTSKKLTASLAALFLVGFAVSAGATDGNTAIPTKGIQIATGSDSTKNNDSFIDDAGLTAKVKAALTKDVGLKTLKLNVDSRQGAVTITGIVNSMREKDTIDRVVRTVEGVKSFDNAVIIQKP